ncbi:MAG: 2-hydroxyglutaryl-CoA dehydratase [Proteobacteria bacterium]|nr:2-hydroxyglutaryl-CoA dehydratase [Pseudomonadota bacterium]
MITAGCDVGSLTSKAVVMKKGRILGWAVIKSKSDPGASAESVMGSALTRAGLSMGEVEDCLGTGYGRERIPFVSGTASEIACHGRGARWLVPSARTVIDVGGQDCKVIRLDAAGRVVRFATNDKCASGTGRFLEVMARVLGIGLEDLGALSARARSPVTLPSTCTVWAQADVIRFLNDDMAIEDVGAGVNNAMAGRVAGLVGGIGPEREVCMTGGVAKNAGVAVALENLLGMRLKKVVKADPQLAGAIGAALLAGEGRGGG